MASSLFDPNKFRHMLAASLLAHLAFCAMLFFWTYWQHERVPPTQNVLVTKLVRLGTPRPEKLLPRKQPTPPDNLPPPAPTTTPTKISPPKAAVPLQAPSTNIAQRIKAMQKTNQALEKLRQKIDGQADGSLDGETDVAQQGDLWATAIKACLMRNYTIEGTDPSTTRGRKATVVIRVLPTGKIVDYAIKVSSGLTAFDQAVGRAITRCGQVPPPPETWKRSVRQNGVEIEFQP